MYPGAAQERVAQPASRLSDKTPLAEMARRFGARLVALVALLSARAAGCARPPLAARSRSVDATAADATPLADAASLADWMASDAAHVYPRTLHDLTLPGTHDSGAYFLTPQLMPGSRFPTPWEAAAVALAERLDLPLDRVITPWALTQTSSVAAQLRAGYRYVDLRAGWNGTRWCAHHAEVGVEVTVILRDVAGFARAHPGEFVILQVSHLDGDPGEERTRDLAATVETELKGTLVRPPADANANATDPGGAVAPRLDRTVGEMVGAGERVLVVFGDGDYARSRGFTRGEKEKKTPPSPFWPPWTLHNAYADSDDPSALDAFARGAVASAGAEGPEGALLKLSWTLTTQTRTVLESALPGRPKSLRELAARIAPRLEPFAESARAAGCRPGNVLSVDFAGEGANAVEVARAANAMVPVGEKCAWAAYGKVAAVKRSA